MKLSIQPVVELKILPIMINNINHRFSLKFIDYYITQLFSVRIKNTKEKSRETCQKEQT